MNDNSKCFVRINKNHYEEITYKELEYRRRTIPEYNNKKFIYVHKMLMEVTEEEYKDYYYEIERNRYCKKVLNKLSALSLEELESLDKLDFMASNDINIEENLIAKFTKEELNRALLMLDEEEYKIIKELFFNNYSLRKYAQKHNISHNTLYSRVKKILNKLRKTLNN